MDGVYIKQAEKMDIPKIRQLAIAVWWPTYGEYLPHDQIRLMLENMYTEHALAQQLEHGQTFLLAYREDRSVGFTSFIPVDRSGIRVVRLEKLYVLPTEHQRGSGKRLLAEVIDRARAYDAEYVELNVNRNNPAKSFYEKQGFAVVDSVDIPYHGYVLNDYVMRKPMIG